jgi:hypothetical protein
MTSPSFTTLVLRDAVDDQRALALAVAHEPDAPVSWSRACTALLSSVSSVTSAALGDTCRHAPDEAVARDDRRLLLDAAVASRGDHDALVELVPPPMMRVFTAL